MNRGLSLALALLPALAIVESTFPAASREAEDGRDLVIEKHLPQYSLLASGYGFGGEGKYRLDIDSETGNVTSVSIVKSTAHKLLDNAAIFALRRWRFRPHSVRAVIVPIDFSVDGIPQDQAQRLAVQCVEPDLPETWHHGKAVYRFVVDYETGRVTDVQVIKSSGLPKFDEAVVKAYRQWRFPPHKIRSIDETVVVRPSYL